VRRKSQAYPMLLIDRHGGYQELKREGWEHFRRGKKR
jgi:hypothetical protein